MSIGLTLCLLFCMGTIVEAQQSPRAKKVDAEAKKAQIQQKLKVTKAQVGLTNKIKKDDVQNRAKKTKLTPAQIQAKKQKIAGIKANPTNAKKNNKKVALQAKHKNIGKKNGKKVELIKFDKAKFQDKAADRKVKLRRQ